MSVSRVLRSFCVAAAPALGLAVAVAQRPPPPTPPAIHLDLTRSALVFLERIAIVLAPELSAAPNANRADEKLAEQHLRDGLTPELLQAFRLFLYVNKAPSGHAAQRLYVFAKQDDGSLHLLHDWAASTGRERMEANPAGKVLPTFTPAGYYQLDRHRFYRNHRSSEWGQPMPYAMFFNRVERGSKTGLAIHAAIGKEIAALGTRASAGCIRLAPENARALFDLIRANYQGSVPRFAFDSKTRTMANNGMLMRDAHGQLSLADGYQVLVLIEDGAGERSVAALL
jgi:lipoprotein-anchoring transpeptidase ErfK/SrfK